MRLFSTCRPVSDRCGGVNPALRDVERPCRKVGAFSYAGETVVLLKVICLLISTNDCLIFPLELKMEGVEIAKVDIGLGFGRGDSFRSRRGRGTAKRQAHCRFWDSHDLMVEHGWK